MTAAVQLCPRCESRVFTNQFNEDECLTCGWANYDAPPMPLTKRKTVFNSGTIYIIRYGGDLPQLKDGLVRAEVVRAKSLPKWNVWCPWCLTLMEQSSLSGKRREKMDERFVCKDGHRVTIWRRVESEAESVWNPNPEVKETVLWR